MRNVKYGDHKYLGSFVTPEEGALAVARYRASHPAPPHEGESRPERRVEGELRALQESVAAWPPVRASTSVGPPHAPSPCSVPCSVELHVRDGRAKLVLSVTAMRGRPRSQRSAPKRVLLPGEESSNWECDAEGMHTVRKGPKAKAARFAVVEAEREARRQQQELAKQQQELARQQKEAERRQRLAEMEVEQQQKKQQKKQQKQQQKQQQQQQREWEKQRRELEKQQRLLERKQEQQQRQEERLRQRQAQKQGQASAALPECGSLAPIEVEGQTEEEIGHQVQLQVKQVQLQLQMQQLLQQQLRHGQVQLPEQLQQQLLQQQQLLHLQMHQVLEEQKQLQKKRHERQLEQKQEHQQQQQQQQQQKQQMQRAKLQPMRMPPQLLPQQTLPAHNGGPAVIHTHHHCGADFRSSTQGPAQLSFPVAVVGPLLIDVAGRSLDAVNPNCTNWLQARESYKPSTKEAAQKHAKQSVKAARKHAERHPQKTAQSGAKKTKTARPTPQPPPPPLPPAPIQNVRVATQCRIWTVANATGQKVLVPATLWPDYECSEHGGAGWEATVVRIKGGNVTSLPRTLT